MKSKLMMALGSNYEQLENMEKAKSKLRSMFPDIRFSSALWTEPIGIPSDDRFVNMLAVAHTDLEREQVEMELKRIERECGRCAEEKEKCIIRMDIDLMSYDGEKFHPKDWARDYIITLMSELEGE